MAWDVISKMKMVAMLALPCFYRWKIPFFVGKGLIVFVDTILTLAVFLNNSERDQVNFENLHLFHKIR